jgi:hypothetical protein
MSSDNLLSRLAAYSSSDSSDSEEEEDEQRISENMLSIKPGEMIKSSLATVSPPKIEIAPAVDTSELEADQRNKELARFETTN